ncbi:HAD family hydrolase [Salinarimonas soli]|uniref:HAD family phosphatase n=1 Tax=Salinarimonas soli TaxID=1638099 RepID=A0A5B2VEB8_9HYPH|nr:HAD family phosphatase [Salinarimonas soli]KAA2237314.1 HAD family phosphatase [Salinarimonas soli]
MIPVFDIGGVLIRWDPRPLFREWISDPADLERFIDTVCPGDWDLEQEGLRPFSQGLAARMARFPEHADLLRAFDDRWIETVPGPIEGTAALLDELRTAGVPTYAITNFSREKFAVLLEHVPFLSGFDGIIVSAHEHLLKPDPRIYALLCERYDLNPADCFFIDDTRANVEAAQAFGMQGHHFTDPCALRLEMRAYGLPV